MCIREIVNRGNMMKKSQKRNPRVAFWIVCIVASIMILLVANSILHYTPGASGGTLLDAIGTFLPYGLIVAIAVYYFLISGVRPSRPTLTAGRMSAMHIIRYIVLMIGGMVMSMAPFLLLFWAIQLSGINLGQYGAGGTIVPYVQSNPIQVGSPSFDIWSSLAIFSVAFVFVTLLLATIVRGKEDHIEETTEELGPTVTPYYGKSGVSDDLHRRAILSYYARGREHMVNQGIPLSEAMTPREFERNVITSHGKAGEDFTPLTHLFEEARYSIHNMGASEKDEAKKHYENLMNKFRERKRVE
jgi:hypothetical protein